MLPLPSTRGDRGGPRFPMVSLLSLVSPHIPAPIPLSGSKHSLGAMWQNFHFHPRFCVLKKSAVPGHPFQTADEASAWHCAWHTVGSQVSDEASQSRLTSVTNTTKTSIRSDSPQTRLPTGSSVPPSEGLPLTLTHGACSVRV